MNNSILLDIEKEIAGLTLKTQSQNVGEVVEVGDGIARIEGLSQVQYAEMIDFGDGIFGLALNLEKNNVGAVIFGDYTKVREGQTVKTTGRVLEVPVGDEYLGR